MKIVEKTIKVLELTTEEKEHISKTLEIMHDICNGFNSCDECPLNRNNPYDCKCAYNRFAEDMEECRILDES